MKVSQKLEYACRVAIQLARSYGGESVFPVEELAAKESVSAPFLVQILNDLRRGGIVLSKRGKMGGYMLARSPGDITLADIIRAIEGEVLGIDSDRKGESGGRVAEVWSELANHLANYAEATTLLEMSTGGALLEYYI